MTEHDRRRRLAWALLIFGAVGLVLTLPAWLLGWVDNRALLGVTLVLSWLALVYPAIVALWTA